jgi:protein-tyrosine-phosphatase
VTERWRIAFSARWVRTRRTVARLLPNGTRTFIRHCAELDARTRTVFVAQSMRRAAGLHPGPRALRRDLHRNVVFVCHGNILRSPFASAELSRLVAESGNSSDTIISSAGLHAGPGSGADPRGIVAARARGVDLEHHHTRPLSGDIVRDASLLVVMDFLNEAQLLTRFPAAREKLMLLGSFDALPRSSLEVVDPYTMDHEGVERCYDDVRRCVRNMYAMMTAAFDPLRAVR